MYDILAIQHIKILLKFQKKYLFEVFSVKGQ